VSSRRAMATRSSFKPEVSPTSAPGTIEPAYQIIKDMPVISSNTGELLAIGSLWDENQTAVVCFLRHFG